MSFVINVFLWAAVIWLMYRLWYRRPDPRPYYELAEFLSTELPELRDVEWARLEAAVDKFLERRR